MAENAAIMEIDTSSIIDNNDNIIKKENIIIIGNSMVSNRFLEKLIDYDKLNKYNIIIFGDEKYHSYDRLNLTSFFEHFDEKKLEFHDDLYYKNNNITINLGDKIIDVNNNDKYVISESGKKVKYDKLVFSTGSNPFVPPIKNYEKNITKGVYVYRTIDDIKNIVNYSNKNKTEHVVVMGGGLLGLEAAKAANDLKSTKSVRVVELMTHLMNRQLDPEGGNLLANKIKLSVGAELSIGYFISNIIVNDNNEITGVEITEFGKKENPMKALYPCTLLIISVGIRPNVELGNKIKDLNCERGFNVNEYMETNINNIYAIGECANFKGFCYGLVAPCYDQADVLARKLTNHNEKKTFNGNDMSTKLKLMGVDVSSFGKVSCTNDELEERTSLKYYDPIKLIYRRLFFNLDRTKLTGGILIGDTSDYTKLLNLVRGNKDLKQDPSLMILPPSLLSNNNNNGNDNDDDMDDDDQLCSCNDISKGQVCKAINEDKCETLDDIIKCTKAGSSCGGCKPLIKTVLKNELKKQGKKISTDVCKHFKYSRKDLFNICKVKQIKNYDDLFKSYGSIGTSSIGCEICKPTIASIIASLFNEHLLKSENAVIQETNDRFLANIQRGGSYSVVPRVPGGEITPKKLIALGQIADKYKLYTKITGGQRVDMFGAQKHELPLIWEDLVEHGFESGHAYGKSLRTVKSCVGSTWCRFGMLDSVGMAIKLEKRYRGIRSPHKFKMAVSGCTRDCAEMANKDCGLVATTNGYEIIVCGNGGAKPRFGDVLISGLDEDKAIQIIDRFFMFYIMTADKLQRTARWMENMDGGLNYLRSVIIDDKLGICDELEKQMKFLVNTYKCEWKEVVNDVEKRKQFQQFVNTDKVQEQIEVMDVDKRGQKRPVDWPKIQGAYPKIEIGKINEIEEKNNDSSSSDDDDNNNMLNNPAIETKWVKIAKKDDIPINGGVTILYGKSQIAIYYVKSNNTYYATSNVCPHRNAPVLSSGLIGELNEKPYIACSLHKRKFDLSTGKGVMGNDEFDIASFPIELRDDNNLYLKLPSIEYLDNILGMDKLMVKHEHSCKKMICETDNNNDEQKTLDW